jgi:hypothetical protein
MRLRVEIPYKMELGERNFCGGLAAASCAIALAACGSSHNPSGSTAASHSVALELASCMRSHGVPNFPGPGGGGGGIDLAGTGINPQSPAFKSAQRACRHLAPAGAGGVVATESQFLAAVRFAKCMRVHGFPDFPDPTHSDSPPGPILVGANGMFFRLKDVSFDPNSPTAKRAFAGCQGA